MQDRRVVVLTAACWAAALLGLLGLLAAPAPAAAQTGAPSAAASEPAWQAMYWNNMSLSGSPVLTRPEADIHHNWGYGTPDPVVNPQRFSARWTRTIEFPTDGVYRFNAASDDGVRVYVDDQPIIDGWYDHPYQNFAAERLLTQGYHLVRVDYYDNAGIARIDFDWGPATPPTPTPSPSTWRGEYFNNRDLQGSPALVRSDSAIDFNWGYGSPAPGLINPDDFSARWTQTVNLAPGAYRFRVTVDDGVRVFVNDQPVIDQWHVQSASTFESADLPLAGPTTLRVEYFEAGARASIQFSYTPSGGAAPTPTPTPTPPDAWRGEYFNNTTLSAPPALVRSDPAIDFNWGYGSPAPGVVNADNFSVRWTRSMNFAPGAYRFRVVSDDGVRLWVNNALIVDAWRQQGASEFSAQIYLPAGGIPLRLEFVEYTGQAQIRLAWDYVGGANPTPTPTSSGGGSTPADSWQTVKPKNPWTGEYYNNADLAGSPTLVRADKNIDFVWGYGAPAPGINPDYFSVRWTNVFSLGGGKYRFTTETDDGVRLYVDGQILIDHWGVQPVTRHSREINLSRGDHTVRMEYQELTGYAVARLKVETLVSSPPPIGNMITCVPPQPQNYAWIKLYRLNTSNQWYSTGSGIGSINSTGYLKIDGLPVDVNRFGNGGEPYKVEQWINGKVARATGDFQQGQPEFRVRPFADNYTPWGCAP